MQPARLLSDRASVPVALLALAAGGLSIALETVFHLPVKLPGHRALPAALALLLFAEAFAPLVLVTLAAAVPLALLLLGEGAAWGLVVWLLPAALLILFEPSRARRPLLTCLALGLLVGLLRYLGLFIRPHHMPEAVRLVGHLCFGGVGGLLALPLVRRKPGEAKR